MNRKSDNLRYLLFSHLPCKLKAWRAEKKIKISTAAEELGVAPSTWSHWESGRRFPSGELLLAIISYTGIPLIELICKNAPHCQYQQREKRVEHEEQVRSDGIPQNANESSNQRQRRKKQIGSD